MSTICPEANSCQFINIAGYKFVSLDDLQERREKLRSLVDRLQLKGTILLSPEGINLFLAGPREAIDAFLQEIHLDAAFTDLETKESVSDHQPLNRMLIKI